MATPYTTIYTSFLDKISDQYLASMIDDSLKAQLLKYLNNAVPKFPKCKKNLSKRRQNKAVLQMNYPMKRLKYLLI